jgi:hypothetical protein
LKVIRDIAAASEDDAIDAFGEKTQSNRRIHSTATRDPCNTDIRWILYLAEGTEIYTCIDAPVAEETYDARLKFCHMTALPERLKTSEAAQKNS